MVNDEEPIEPPLQSAVSEKDEQLLNHLALIARVIQQQANPPSQNHDKSLWKAFQEPAVLAALVTVLIGGIAATLITGIIQWQAGIREFEQGWLKARGDQAL